MFWNLHLVWSIPLKVCIVILLVYSRQVFMTYNNVYQFVSLSVKITLAILATVKPVGFLFSRNIPTSYTKHRWWFWTIFSMKMKIHPQPLPAPRRIWNVRRCKEWKNVCLIWFKKLCGSSPPILFSPSSYL